MYLLTFFLDHTESLKWSWAWRPSCVIASVTFFISHFLENSLLLYCMRSCNVCKITWIVLAWIGIGHSVGFIGNANYLFAYRGWGTQYKSVRPRELTFLVIFVSRENGKERSFKSIHSLKVFNGRLILIEALLSVRGSFGSKTFPLKSRVLFCPLWQFSRICQPTQSHTVRDDQ